MGSEATDKLKRLSGRLNTLMDYPFDPSTPSEADIEKKVTEQLEKLAPIIMRVPFTLDHAKSALALVQSKLPPNGPKSQQFKDSAIWQAILTLSMEYNVYFVSNDRDFLEKGKDAPVLASNLLTDCKNLGATVEFSLDLTSCLKKIRQDIPKFDQYRVQLMILTSVLPGLKAEADRNGFLLEGVRSTDIAVEAFRLPKTSRLALDYRASARCQRVGSALPKSDAIHTAIIHGSCYYDPSEDTLTGHFIEYVTFESKTPGGGSVINRWFKYEDPQIPFPRPVDLSQYGTGQE